MFENRLHIIRRNIYLFLRIFWTDNAIYLHNNWTNTDVILHINRIFQAKSYFEVLGNK